MLEVKNLNAFYGPAQALFDVSLRVAAGEMVVLQGLNGAGKSTLLKAVMGLQVRTEGGIFYSREGSNADISRWETHKRAQAGLGYVAEDRRLFTGLTVRENLHVAANHDAKAQEARVLDLFPILKPLLVASIRDALLALKNQGLALLVVEQNRLLAERADRLLWLVAGKVKAS